MHIFACTCTHTHVHTQIGSSVKWWSCYILIRLIISQCRHIPDPQIVDLKYTHQFYLNKIWNPCESKQKKNNWHCKWFWNPKLYFIHSSNWGGSEADESFRIPCRIKGAVDSQRNQQHRNRTRAQRMYSFEERNGLWGLNCIVTDYENSAEGVDKGQQEVSTSKPIRLLLTQPLTRQLLVLMLAQLAPVTPCTPGESPALSASYQYSKHQ